MGVIKLERVFMNRLHNKIVLITGATSGIGYASASAFAKQGAKLIIVGRREEKLFGLRDELIKNYAATIYAYTLDVRDKSQVDKFFAAIPDEFKTIDILLNNAGLALGLSHTIDSLIDDWEVMIDTNVKGLLYMTKSVLDIMYPRLMGHIINIGSLAGIDYYANASVYCASKAAVHAFSNALREECIEKNIRVSEILPGMVNTEFSQVRFNGDDERANNVYAGVEYLVADDIADLIVYTANLPAHINLAEALIMPTAQANSHKVYRG
jgi:NADP-dependent 3-hydroxy acid dehydrogenase YdfG